MVESVELSQLRGWVLIGHLCKPPAKRDPRVIQSALEARVGRIADPCAKQQEPHLRVQSTQGNRSSGGKADGGPSYCFSNGSRAGHAMTSTARAQRAQP